MNAVAWAEEPKPEKDKPFLPRAWGEQVRQEHSRPSSQGERGGRAAPACTAGSSGQGGIWLDSVPAKRGPQYRSVGRTLVSNSECLLRSGAWTQVA